MPFARMRTAILGNRVCTCHDKLTANMVSHSVQQAVSPGDHIVMTHRSHVLHDFHGAVNKRLGDEALLDRFNKVRRREPLAESAAAMFNELHV